MFFFAGHSINRELLGKPAVDMYSLFYEAEQGLNWLSQTYGANVRAIHGPLLWKMKSLFEFGEIDSALVYEAKSTLTPWIESIRDLQKKDSFTITLVSSDQDLEDKETFAYDPLFSIQKGRSEYINTCLQIPETSTIFRVNIKGYLYPFNLDDAAKTAFDFVELYKEGGFLCAINNDCFSPIVMFANEFDISDNANEYEISMPGFRFGIRNRNFFVQFFPNVNQQSVLFTSNKVPLPCEEWKSCTLESIASEFVLNSVNGNSHSFYLRYANLEIQSDIFDSYIFKPVDFFRIGSDCVYNQDMSFDSFSQMWVEYRDTFYTKIDLMIENLDNNTTSQFTTSERGNRLKTSILPPAPQAPVSYVSLTVL